MEKASEDERKQAIQELNQLMGDWEGVEKEKNGSFGFYTIVGQKADLLFMNLRPTMEELTELEMAFNKTKIAEYLEPAYSYVSVVELSTYMSKAEDMEKALKFKHVCIRSYRNGTTSVSIQWINAGKSTTTGIQWSLKNVAA